MAGGHSAMEEDSKSGNVLPFKGTFRVVKYMLISMLKARNQIHDFLFVHFLCFDGVAQPGNLFVAVKQLRLFTELTGDLSQGAGARIPWTLSFQLPAAWHPAHCC